jgi:hypothetical protein
MDLLLQRRIAQRDAKLARQSNSRRTKLDAPRQITVFGVFKFNFSRDETAPQQLKGDIFPLCQHLGYPITKWKFRVLLLFIKSTERNDFRLPALFQEIHAQLQIHIWP